MFNSIVLISISEPKIALQRSNLFDHLHFLSWTIQQIRHSCIFKFKPIVCSQNEEILSLALDSNASTINSNDPFNSFKKSTIFLNKLDYLIYFQLSTQIITSCDWIDIYNLFSKYNRSLRIFHNEKLICTFYKKEEISYKVPRKKINFKRDEDEKREMFWCRS